MKKIHLANIQEGVRKLGAVKAFFEHIESAYVSAMAELVKGLIAGVTTPVCIHGCVNSGSGSNYNISAGAIWNNGEVFAIPAFAGSAGGGQVPVLALVETFTQLGYTDNTNHNTLNNRTYVWQFGAPGSGIADFSALSRLATIINNTLLDVDGQLGSLQSTVNGQLALKANIDSPELTGTPTAPTQSNGNNSTRIATTAFVQSAIANLIASAPGALDTLDELAAALGDDANFAANITSLINSKVSKAGDTMSGNLNMGGNKVINIGSGTSSQEAVNRGQLDAEATARASGDTAEATARANADALKANKALSSVWTPVPLSTHGSYSGILTPGYEAQYCKDDLGFVHLRGRVRCTSSSPTLMSSPGLLTLPTDHRPPVQLTINASVHLGDIFVGTTDKRSIGISSAGEISLESAASDNVLVLDGISFYVG